MMMSLQYMMINVIGFYVIILKQQCPNSGLLSFLKQIERYFRNKINVVQLLKKLKHEVPSLNTGCRNHFPQIPYISGVSHQVTFLKQQFFSFFLCLLLNFAYFILFLFVIGIVIIASLISQHSAPELKYLKCYKIKINTELCFILSEVQTMQIDVRECLTSPLCSC